MITLTPRRKERLAKYLTEQLSESQKSRRSRVELWNKYMQRYEAKSKAKTFPWRGASSVHVPLVAIFYDSIKARIMNALRAQDKLISCEPLVESEIPGLLDPETGQPITWRTVSELLEQYLLYEISPSGQVNLVDALDRYLDDILLLGTGMLKTIFETIQTRDYTDDGRVSVDVTSYYNVKFVVPALESILFPSGYDSFDRIPWVSHLYLLRPSEMLNKVVTHGWDESGLKSYLKGDTSSADLPETTKAQIETEGVDDALSYSNEEKWVSETWLRFDLDGDGKERRILVDHLMDDITPDTIFRAIPWPYAHGEVPFSFARYIRRRNRVYGMGIPERLEALDEALSTAMNQVIDNVTLANTRAWSVRRDSLPAQANDDIWPGKKIFRDEPDDIQPLQMGEVYPSIFETLNIIRDYAERVAKITDYNLGRESQVLGRQSTATATLALLQESGQYFDNVTRDIRISLNRALSQWLDLLVQHRPLQRVRQVIGPKADILMAALTLPPGDLRSRIGVRVAFSSDAATRELARQEEQAKLTMLRQYYMDLLQMAQLRFQPNTPPQIGILIDEIAKDAELHVRKLLDAYGEPFTTTTLPSWGKAMQSAPPESRPGLREALTLQQIAAATGLGQVPGMEAGGGQAPAPSGAPPGPAEGGSPEPGLQ